MTRDFAFACVLAKTLPKVPAMHGAGRPLGLLGRGAAAAVLCSSVLLSVSAHADEPVAPEEDTNPKTKPPASARVNVVLVGLAVTAGWYGVAAGTSYLWPDSDGASALRIPVAGPYMALAKTGCSDAEPDCTTLTVVVRTVFTALSAIGQTGGVLAMGEGLFLPTADGASRRRAEAPKDAPGTWKLGPRASVSVAPAMVGHAGFGLGLSGIF